MNTPTTTPMNDRYWASSDLKDLPDAIRDRGRAFWERLERDGRIDLLRRLERTYYGLDSEGGWGTSAAVTFGGEGGENVQVRVNEFRSIVRAIAALVTAERPAFVAQALQNDGASLDAAPLCEGIVNAYYETRGLEDVAQEAARVTCLVGEAFVHMRWDPFAGGTVETVERQVYRHGQPVTRTEQRTEVRQEIDALGTVREVPEVVTVEVPELEQWPEREGDVVPVALTPLQVVRDLDDPGPMRWACVAHVANVWDLAARYPELRERILDARGSLMWPRRVWETSPDERVPEGISQDSVTVWYLYHLPCDAVRDGRFAIVCGDVVLFDGPLPLDTLPVIAVIPERQHDTSSGDAPVTDLLCLQELYDAAWSALMTPIDALAVQNVAVPDGQDVNVEALSRGLQLLKYAPMPGMPNGGAPVALQLLRTPEELWRLVELVPQVMQRISGINSVTRGAPDSNIKAGNYAALISAQAQQYHGPLARAVMRMHEQIGTMVLKLLRTYATTKRVAEIGGKTRQTALREFMASDLAIERVSLDTTNPLTRQIAGRLEIGQMLLATPGLVQTPEQFLQFLSSGRIDPMYESQARELTLIKRENEMLADGTAPPVALVDRHDLHIAEHKAVVADPDLRMRRPDVMRATLEHLMEHVRLAAEIHATPALAFATGQRIPPAMAAGVPGGAPPPGPGAGPPAPRAQVAGAAQGEDLPTMPTNPQTGQRAPAAQPGATT
jgi:hypothetical protein